MTKTVVLYTVSILSVLALSTVYPKIAVYLVGLLIIGVLVEHGTEYANIISGVQAVSTGEALK